MSDGLLHFYDVTQEKTFVVYPHGKDAAIRVLMDSPPSDADIAEVLPSFDTLTRNEQSGDLQLTHGRVLYADLLEEGSDAEESPDLILTAPATSSRGAKQSPSAPAAGKSSRATRKGAPAASTKRKRKLIGMVSIHICLFLPFHEIFQCHQK
jgi:hypothetical protein